MTAISFLDEIGGLALFSAFGTTLVVKATGMSIISYPTFCTFALFCGAGAIGALHNRIQADHPHRRHPAAAPPAAAFMPSAPSSHNPITRLPKDQPPIRHLIPPETPTAPAYHRICQCPQCLCMPADQRAILRDIDRLGAMHVPQIVPPEGHRASAASTFSGDPGNHVVPGSGHHHSNTIAAGTNNVAVGSRASQYS